MCPGILLQESMHVFTCEWCSNVPSMNAHQLDNFLVQLFQHHTLRDGIQHQIQYKFSKSYTIS
jgi:hypothetical protein